MSGRKKKLEDELRSVWEEWATPHEYGLYHDHKEETMGGSVLEAVGAKAPHEPAPDPPNMDNDAYEDASVGRHSEPEHKEEEKVEHREEKKVEHREEKKAEHRPKLRGRSPTVKSALKESPRRKRTVVSVVRQGVRDAVLGRPNGTRAQGMKVARAALGAASTAAGYVRGVAGAVGGAVKGVVSHLTTRKIPVTSTSEDPKYVPTPPVTASPPPISASAPEWKEWAAQHSVPRPHTKVSLVERYGKKKN